MPLRYCLLLLLAVHFQARAQTSATLRTRQTVLTLAARESAPVLLKVGTEGAEIWQNSAPEPLIDSVFIGSRKVPIQWKFNNGGSRVGTRNVTFVYRCQNPSLLLTWNWSAPSEAGPVEHTTHIQNLSSQELWIPLQDSLHYNFSVQHNSTVKHFYVEKGAGKPSDAGTDLVDVPAGYQWQGFSSTYAHPAANQPREIIPFLALQRFGQRTDGWYAGIEFSGRTRLTVNRDSGHISGSLGLNPDPGPFRSRLAPGETFDTPTVFLGAFTGDINALGNVLRPWIRQVLGHPQTWANPNYPLLVNNSWGSGMAVDESLAQKMIRDSAELGLEMFHIDAGWFRGVGDWYPDPKKFPHGLAPIAQNAHQHGLKFGLWCDWAQAAIDTDPGALNLRTPAVHDWTVADVPANWRPEAFKGQTIDIGDPPANQYAKLEVNRILDSYHLDMLEHDGYVVAQGCIRTDHTHAPPDPFHTNIQHDEGFDFVTSDNSTDVSYRATRAYYDIYSDLRRRHPNVLLEVCNDGGRMVDFGSAAHADYFSVTDTYDPLSNRRAFYDASHVLPAAMLESYVEKWPTPHIENFRYMLRSGMQGWLTIMLDTNAWNAEQHTTAKEEFQIYKSQLRPLIRDADIYHIAPRPDGVHWDGTEFFDQKRRRGVVFAFRGSIQHEGNYTYKLEGLDRRKNYRVHFHDASSPDRTMGGEQLTTAGLTVHLPIPNSSELVFLQEDSN